VNALNIKEHTISVIMPALNEELNISNAIGNTLKAFDDYSIVGEIIIVNDGSTDGTEQTVQSFSQEDSRIKMIVHDKPKGIGASFWDGIDNAQGNIIVLIPGDNEIDPWEIFRYCELLDNVDIVIPFVYNEQVRPLFRRILSFLYRFIVNVSFFTNFNYTNGTILYRKSILKELEYRSSGFFFQTDILIRTVKRGYLYAEVPYRLGIREHGVSRAVSFPSLLKVIKGYLKLIKDHYCSVKIKNNKIFAADSKTATRKDK